MDKTNADNTNFYSKIIKIRLNPNNYNRQFAKYY